MRLGDYAEPLAYEIAAWVQAFDKEGYPLDELGRTCIDLCCKFRVLAIILLVSEGDAVGFHRNLYRSAALRLKYLRLLAQRGVIGQHHQAAGRYGPLLDAIACGGLQLARELGRESPVERYEGSEYVSDHLYSKLLWRLAEGEADCRQLLERLASCGEPFSGARLRACAAIAAADGAEFERSFEDILRERGEEIALNQQRGEAEEVGVIAERRVFIEGLALLRLAEAHGVVTDQNYQFCPALARMPLDVPLEGL